VKEEVSSIEAQLAAANGRLIYSQKRRNGTAIVCRGDNHLKRRVRNADCGITDRTAAQSGNP
jgi:hypothetical protein